MNLLSPEQVPEQVPEQAEVLLHTNNALIIGLIITPAVKEGYVRMLYPDKPRHPKQRYLLTEKGLKLYNELKKNA